MTVPAPTFRSYRLKWTYHVAALFPVLFGIVLTVVALGMDSHTSPTSRMITWLVVFLFIATGIPLTAYTLSARVQFTQNSVEQRTLFSRRTLALDAIRGRRNYSISTTEGIEALRSLVPNDSALKEMDLSRKYKFDETFLAWFNSLPDLGKPKP